MSRGHLSFLIPPALLCCAGMLVAAVGCGESKPKDITAANSKYAPATGGSETGSDSRQVPAPAGGSAEAEPAAPRAGGAPDRPAEPKKGVAEAGKPSQPKVSYEVPEGGVPELLAHIEKLDQALNEMLSQAQALEPVKAEAQKNLDAQEAAADKILTLNPEEAARVEAISAKARALQAKFQLQIPGAEEKLTALLEEISSDDDEDLQHLAAIFRMTIPLTKLKAGTVEESEPVLQALDQFLANLKTFDASSFGYAVETIRTFQMLGRMDEMIATMRTVGKAFQTSPNEQVALSALSLTQQAGQYLEFTGRVDEAKEVYASLQEHVAKIANPDVKQQLEESLVNATKRTSLVGQELPLDNLVDVEGKPIDPAAFKGKVVLLDFWATWCGPCIAEIPNIAEAYAAYKEQGFEVIGVNLDDNVDDVRKFFEKDKLEWTVALSADESKRGFETPLASQCGVDAIPFMLLLDQTGKVAAIHTRGPRLELEVRKLLNLGEGEEAPAGDQPKEPAGDEAAAPSEDSAEKSPPANSSEEPEAGVDLQPANGEEAPKGDAAETEESAAVDRSATEFVVLFASDEDAERQPGEAAESEKNAPSEQATRNAYLADADLSTFELVQFIQEMEDKPRAIQQRPGFAEAVADAADRILADKTAKEKYQVAAALAKFKFLHDRASFGDDKADAALAAFVDQMKNDPRETIAKEVKLLQLERRALDAEKLDIAQIEPLLADVKKYVEEHRQALGEKHLRLASATVGAINRIEDGQTREKLFRDFGSLFATSVNKELARYGKRLAKETPSTSALVGQTLELDGLTELGSAFDWKAYRGKIVVVDFWATWCGPCRRAAPAVKAFYEAQRENGFEVVGVNLDQDHEALSQYLDEQKIPWSNIVGEGGTRLAEKYEVRGIPTFVLVDREGKVLDVGHSFEAMQSKIEELLKAS